MYYYNKPTGADAFRENTQSLLSELAMTDTNTSEIPSPPIQRPMIGPSSEVPIHLNNPFQDPLTLPPEIQYQMSLNNGLNNQPIDPTRGGSSDFPSDDGNHAPYRES